MLRGTFTGQLGVPKCGPGLEEQGGGALLSRETLDPLDGWQVCKQSSTHSHRRWRHGEQKASPEADATVRLFRHSHVPRGQAPGVKTSLPGLVTSLLATAGCL